MTNFKFSIDEDSINNHELAELSEKIQSFSTRFKSIHSKTREKTRNLEVSMRSISTNLTDLKNMIDNHNYIHKHCSECIEQIQFYFVSMKTLKRCNDDIYKIALEPKTIDQYIENVRTIDYYIKFFQTNAPLFPETKDWEVLQQKTYDILTGYINNFLEADVETNIDYITEVVNSWVISGIRPFQDDFVKRRTDNLSDGVLDKIIDFMREKGRYIFNDVQFTNRRKNFYENVITNFHKQNTNSPTDDKKSNRSTNSLEQRRKSMRRVMSTILVDMLFQPTSTENTGEQLSDDLSIVSKIYAISLLVLKMDICSVEKVYTENARKDINSSLLVHFWSLVLKIIENANAFLTKSIKFHTLDGCLRVIQIILPILAFFFDNQDRALELSHHGHHSQMEMFILNLTNPLENLFFEALKSFDDLLKDKTVYDYIKTNEFGIDEKIVMVLEFISKLHTFLNVVGYTCVKNKITMEFSKLEDIHYSHLRLLTEPMIAKYITFPLSAVKNVPYPKKEIYMLNQCRYILESVEDGVLQNMTLPNTVNFYKAQLNELIETSKMQYLKYWEKGIEPIKSMYEKLKSSIEKYGTCLVDLKSKDKALIKSGFSDFKDFMKQVPEDHDNIKFYNSTDIKYLKEQITEKIINPYGQYCEVFAVISTSKSTKEHIKIWKEDILGIVDGIFII